MGASALLETAGLLGLFVLLAGGYGVLYGLGRLRRQRALVVAGVASYALQWVVVGVVLLDTPLQGGWKAFVVISCVAYCAIPPLTWRCLAALHAVSHSQS